MTAYAVVPNFMGHAEFLKSFARDVRCIKDTELVANFDQHPRHTRGGVGFRLHNDSFVSRDSHRINAQTIDLHFSQDGIRGRFRDGFARDSGFGDHFLSGGWFRRASISTNSSVSLRSSAVSL